MIDLKKAYTEFDNYLDGFDRNNEKIKLKIIHTNEVVRCAGEIAKRMNLSQEDRELAEVIALLHDIGRFEQVRRYDSFEPGTMDHAHFGVELLFGSDSPWIRSFVDSDRWDDVIREAIGRHSDYSVGFIKDERILLHAKLIRDADKLDNCRVKLADDMKVLLAMDAEEVGAQSVTDMVFQECMNYKSIRSADRVTKMDYWISYIAYFFDINFRETFQIIKENDFVNRIIDRVPYSNPDTRDKMEQIRVMVNEYVCRMSHRMEEQEMFEMFTDKMIAPCGLDCSLCRHAHDPVNPCEGCLGPDEKKYEYCHTKCDIMKCEKYQQHRYRFCDVCPDYPCEAIWEKENRYGEKYVLKESPIQNLKDIREIGMPAFLEKQKQCFTCPACGDVILVHTGICRSCGFLVQGEKGGL